ncbi:hypothetical protein PG326_02855 [Riemerella anatipestifer]|nr:hypothetical protein [Riemerella anatipestifer]MDY3357276.1 hypothetical protein [Riemerella anatipestifer]
MKYILVQRIKPVCLIREKESETYSNAITYDTNGNMTSLLDKKISRIGYNTLNLPNQVQSAVGNLSYTYRADGAKLKKVIDTDVTYYLDGFQYNTYTETYYLSNPVISEPKLLEDTTPSIPEKTNNTRLVKEVKLSFFPTSEGYYDYLHKRYVYHYTDHLGNVRLSYYRSNNGSYYRQRV